MNSPYCGWNKNTDDETIESSNFDFLQLNVKDGINKQANEIDSNNDEFKYDNNELK